MKIFFGQIYIKPGVWFSFSHGFQAYLSEEVSTNTEMSTEYKKRFGQTFSLMFNISAKQSIVENEVRGPTVFKKTKDVEYTIFLPFDVIKQKKDVNRAALQFLFKGVYTVLGSLEIDTDELKGREAGIIDRICSDPAMLDG